MMLGSVGSHETKASNLSASFCRPQGVRAPGQTCQNEQKSGEPSTGESVVIVSKEEFQCLVKNSILLPLKNK